MNSTLKGSVIWNGILEYFEKNNNTNSQKQIWHISCQILTKVKNGEPEVKAESWPSKLVIHLMPKTIAANIGQDFYRNSKSVLFMPSSCDALDSLIKMMSSHFVGCVHFPSTPNCNIKVLLLVYNSKMRAFIGCIPNDHQVFINRLRRVIQEQKNLITNDRASEVMSKSTDLMPTSGEKDQMFYNNSSSWHESQEPPTPTSLSTDQSLLDLQPVESTSCPEINSQENMLQQRQVLQMLDEAPFNQTVKVEPQQEMNFQYNNVLQQENGVAIRQENLQKIQHLMTACQAAQANLTDAWNNLSRLQQDLKNAQDLELQFRQSDFNLNFFSF